MKTILAAVDFSDVTQGVVQAAADLAAALGAELWLVHVAAPDPEFVGYDVDPPALRDVHAAVYRDEHRHLQALAEPLRGRGIDVRALLIQGPTVEKILAEAERAAADLIVVGSHGHGALHRVLLGSTSEGLMRRSRRPLLVVPAGPREGEPPRD